MRKKIKKRAQFIFLQELPLWAGQQWAASKDEWQQDGENLERLPPGPKSAGSGGEGRVQPEGVESAGCTTATVSGSEPQPVHIALGCARLVAADGCAADAS